MNMFKTTTAKTPSEYIALFSSEDQKQLKILDSLIQKETQFTPHIQSGMLAYGNFHYKSKSRREGDWMTIALARQKSYFSLYVCSVDDKGKYIAEKYKSDLPKASIGKSCIRFKKIEDIDIEIIKEVLKESVKFGGAFSA